MADSRIIIWLSKEEGIGATGEPHSRFAAEDFFVHAQKTRAALQRELDRWFAMRGWCDARDIATAYLLLRDVR